MSQLMMDHILQGNRPQALDIDARFNYLIGLWNEWITAILQYVPTDNEYFNLKFGITDQERQRFMTIQGELSVPDELVAFYQIYDVDYAVIASPFSFEVAGGEYDLIPFRDIKKQWTFNQNLNIDDEPNPEIIDFSPKVTIPKGYDYASPAWIPIAEDKGGNFLLYDTQPSSQGKYGQIIELINETWERNVVADSLADLLRFQLDEIQQQGEARFEFILEDDD